ncbi:2,3-diaminopropionate biosynthesis protein SbnA [Streptomyces griseus]|uniref:Cystathionine beta-synthase n=1 Tax=Streptomyces griseus subsp. griseus (strain JCM 4626 / CBS 651.72 / NBRC 13350 / KCC S-0626 / ISP 5235) TaxID=455632 RepID=B1W2Q7_STRGG|nr:MULTISPECIES: 2,3-diaminopropionate biosynthesis protein SbnA [Streptomyces]MYR11623.1 2,3-diaminopropionate biosynthesis protein SbnA [Streptomyces sp. SID724]MYR50236.1 2,3-diaminopropionate biosynthesis protein SbnA [Streptomyces sp. SID4928]MYT80899.1 2,3-diaminopropionate biosynthesis protein SbnA [Streptomyces sp. SID8364]EGE42188.1 Cysteine synthase [Streptomyces sp. ACT-1]MBW3705059.1 2,3-diaminopropionate biosynthesis protein SbnA [Streptomyces griseus]
MNPLRKRLDMIGASVGRTPLLWLPDDSLSLFAKLESVNPNGSTKDRSAYWILKKAIERGDITENTTVVESSSGNFATSLAVFCQSLGIRFVPVIDANCNALTEAVLRSCCERVEKVVAPEGAALLPARLARVAELRAEISDVYWPNQYANGDAADAHYQLTGGELSSAFSRIDYLFVGVGTGGTIAGLSRRVKDQFPGATVVAVDVHGSVALGGAPGKRHIPGLGSSMVPPLLDQALIDHVMHVSEYETVIGCRTLYAEHGLYAGGSTGSVYAAIGRYFAEHPVPPGERPTAVFLCADRGIPYARTVYDLDWVERTLAPDAVATAAL